MTFRFEKHRRAPTSFRKWVDEHSHDEDGQCRAWNELDRDVKSQLRTRLFTDQHGLCCYCYVRIKDDYTSHIEHIDAQNDDNRFDWNNLALACEGGNLTNNPHHCDHRKADQPLELIHPYHAPVHLFTRLGGSKGQLKPIPGRNIPKKTWEDDIEEVLDLNASHLKRKRVAAFQAATADLTRGHRRRRHWRLQDLQASLNEVRARLASTKPGSYDPLLAEWLERKVARS